uniref:Uncharacterized protein n=1 Tax=Timema bartmani TaxID=61472 RepID=A0A7R9HZ50_9NEOP|nr:unnamed protein product [Timema bartmani]
MSRFDKLLSSHPSETREMLASVAECQEQIPLLLTTVDNLMGINKELLLALQGNEPSFGLNKKQRSEFGALDLVWQDLLPIRLPSLSLSDKRVQKLGQYLKEASARMKPSDVLDDINMLLVLLSQWPNLGPSVRRYATYKANVLYLRTKDGK